MRKTKARIAVLQILEEQGRPLAVSEIRKFLSKKFLNPDEATVYRILEAFSQKGLVQKIRSAKFSQALYEINATDHHHFTCDSCGTILEINSCSLGSLINKLKTEKNLLIKGHQLEFSGLCSKCQ